jgi:hypothetical protein
MNKNLRLAALVGICFVLFFVVTILSRLFQVGDLPVQITGALLGAVVTALMTYFLLAGQTAQEEIKERQVRVFEKKQDVYHGFLEELKKIIQDGEIKIDTGNSVDELKDLIFQFGYLEMHTSEETINEVLKRVAHLIQLMNDYNSVSEQNKQGELAKYYAALSNEIFEIIATLKKDLYGKEFHAIPPDRIADILKGCALFVDTDGFDRYEIQTYFWNTLAQKLREKGYKVPELDFTQNIQAYYAKARNRHRWFGFEFEVCHSERLGEKILFRTEIDNHFYYGFCPEMRPIENRDPVFAEVVGKCSPLFQQNSPHWFGWKSSELYDLDFWKLDSGNFEQLKNPRKREAFMENLANEMDAFIQSFVKLAKEANA